MGNIDRGAELDFIYSRYHQAELILDLPLSEADKIIRAGYRTIWEDRCWNKWLNEGGADKSYPEYEREFFKGKKAPDLNKALEVAAEIKRREKAKR